jgi:SAM-dependent methyltransferase
MTGMDPDHLFDAFYYAHGCGAPYERSPEFLTFFDRIAERIQSDIRPKTVLDAGCAMGFLVESLHKLGIEAYGIDISSYAIEQVHPPVRSFCSVGSVVEPFPRHYDLIVSIEVVEHMPKEDAEKAIANLCRHTSDILFSSTPFDFKEITHFNVQPPEYWAELYARNGFVRDHDFDASVITPWAVRFRRQDEPAHRIVRGYERSTWQLRKENDDLRRLSLEMRSQLSSKENELVELREEFASLKEGLAEIHRSAAWNLVRRLQALRLALAPTGSRRERLFHALIKRGDSHQPPQPSG